MSKKVYSESNIAAVANAIREKTGTDNLYKTSEMPDGIAEVYEAGKKAEYDEYWDAFQQKGEREHYSYAFSYSTEKTLRPKYDIAIISGEYAFYKCTVKNLEEHLQQCGKRITFGTSHSTGNCGFCFYYSEIETIPELAVNSHTVKYFFGNCTKLKTIRKLTIVYEADWSLAFNYCNALENITFGGEITRQISFKHSPLTVESVKSVITHLKNYAGSSKEYTYTVTFKTTVFEPLEAEGKTSPNGNTWAEYIDDLKWNLTLA